MIEPRDRSRRYSARFQFTTTWLRDLIDPNRLLVRIDEQLDSARLVRHRNTATVRVSAYRRSSTVAAPDRLVIARDTRGLQSGQG